MNHPSLKEQILYLEKQLMSRNYNKLNEHLADSFFEFGSSGNIFDKDAQLEVVSDNQAVPYTVTDFNITLLASDIVLATYHTVRQIDHATVLRSSIWKNNQGNWQMVFHQGTPTNMV